MINRNRSFQQGCIAALMLLFISMTAAAQKDSTGRMEWFGNARLGIFIHWGIYSVNGIDESWSFFNGQITYGDYMKQLDGFTAAKYKRERCPLCSSDVKTS
jgi:alpha-L-fucosidase